MRLWIEGEAIAVIGLQCNAVGIKTAAGLWLVPSDETSEPLQRANFIMG